MHLLPVRDSGFADGSLRRSADEPSAAAPPSRVRTLDSVPDHPHFWSRYPAIATEGHSGKVVLTQNFPRAGGPVVGFPQLVPVGHFCCAMCWWTR